MKDLCNTCKLTDTCQKYATKMSYWPLTQMAVVGCFDYQSDESDQGEQQ